jgi:outer membrane protein
MNKALLLTATLLALPALGADGPRIIDFEQAIRIALERNGTLRQAENAAAISEVAVSEARNQFVPDLRFSTSGSQSYGRNFSETEGRVIDQSTRSMNAGLNSGVTLFDGFRNTSNLGSARLNEQASKFSLGRTRETVVFTVASNFLALVQQREQLRVQRENLESAVALEKQIQIYVDAGARTVADLYQQQATVANSRLTLVQQERATELAKVDLIQTLQLDPQGVFEFESPAPESITISGKSMPAAPAGGAQPAAAPEFDLDALLTSALAQRADIAAERARVEASGYSIRAAKAGRWPSLSLSAGYNSGYTTASPLSFDDQLDLRRGGSVGLSVSVPIFDRHNVRNATRRAQLQALNARIALENAEQEVSLQVRRAHLDYLAARQQFAAAEAQQRAAELALKYAQERYGAGASTLVELTQARATHTQAVSSRVTARYNLLFQRTLMDYYIGNLDLDVLQ